MSNYVCWLCKHQENRKSDLKYHLSSIHDRLKLVCAWCEGRELTFRKAVDLKLHVKANHHNIFRDAPSDCFGEPNSFWFSLFPKDYIRLIKPTRPDSSGAKFGRRAIEKWWPSVRSKTARSIEDWRKGWSCVPLLTPSPSPSLDFLEDRPIPKKLSIHQINIGSDKIEALVYEDFSNTTIWYRCLLKSSILTVQKQRDSLLRRMEQIKPHHGAVPDTFCDVMEGERLKFASNRLCNVLKVDTSYFATIHRLEQASFSDIKPCKRRPKEEEEPVEPEKKKQRTALQSPAPVPELSEVQNDRTCKKKVGSFGSRLDSQWKPVVDGVGVAENGWEISNPTRKDGMSEAVKNTIDEGTELRGADTADLTQKSKPLMPLDVLLPEPVSPVGPSSERIEPAKPDKTMKAKEIAQVDKSDTQIAGCRVPSVPTTSNGDTETEHDLHHPKSDTTATEEDLLPSMGDGSSSSGDQQPSDAQSTEESQLQTMGEASSSIGEESQPNSVSDATTNHEVQSHEDPQHFEDVYTTSGEDEHVQHPESSSSFTPIQIDQTGDHRYAVQESPESIQEYPESMSYIPTPKNQLTWSFSPLSLRADALLRIGCMPLLPPARRNWTKEEQIALPEGSPMTRWPPKGWSNFTPDVKLLLLETVATTLALKDGLALDRLDILDTYNFLALPGSSNPKLSTNTQKARYFNFRTVADIRMGLSKSSAFISMMEAAKATSSPPLTAVIILQQIERLKISIRI